MLSSTSPSPSPLPHFGGEGRVRGHELSIRRSIIYTNINNTNTFIVFTCHCEPEGRACTPKCLPSPKHIVRAGITARRRGNPTEIRCEGVARGNLKSSLALLGTRLCRFAPRNDKLFKAFVLEIFLGHQIFNLCFFRFGNNLQQLHDHLMTFSPGQERSIESVLLCPVHQGRFFHGL